MKRKIVVLGGYGTLGRQICSMLVNDPAIDCVVAGRDAARGQAFAGDIGAGFQLLDSQKLGTLRTALQGAFAVVDASGPFQGRSYAVPEACIELGVHYADVADAREYVAGFSLLDPAARAKGSLLVTGASTIPAAAGALIDSMAGRFDRIDEIHTAVSIGNRDMRGPASLRAILSYAGRSLSIVERGGWRDVYGWSRPQTVRFPSPIGKRRVYIADGPDLDIFPKRYGAHTVTERVGMQLRLFNHGLYVMARLKRHNRIADLSRHTRSLMKASKLFKAQGDATGGLLVAVRGEHQGQSVTHHAFLVVRGAHGLAIPASPVVALIRKWVSQGVNAKGAVPCVGLVTLEDLRREFVGYDISLVYA
jgi:saccharopine dehydrogenase-like NADP-dependent oxidoreductase